MIPLTPTTSLYPLWAPDCPSILGWRTVLRGLLLCLSIRRWWHNRKQQETHGLEEVIQATPAEFSLPVWIQELQAINTSIRTPAQKAQALLEHLYIYLAHLLPTEDLTWYTLNDISVNQVTKHMAPHLRRLYDIVYTDKKITHKDIDTFVRSLTTDLSGL